MNKRTILSLSICVPLLSPQALQATVTALYGVTALDSQLFTIDPVTGSGTLVGSLGGTVTPYGIAALGNTLYTFDPNTDRIRPIDPTSGSAGSAINIGVGDLQGEGDLTFRSDGTGFLVTVFESGINMVNDLYTFDIAKGTSTRIGSTGTPIDGLAFDGSALYGLGQADGTLYRIDLSNASASPVGSLGIEHNSPFGGLAFGPNGTLYAAVDDRLVTVDKATGAASLVDPNVLDFGFSSVSGIAFRANGGATSVPDGGPGLAMISLTLAGLVFSARFGGRLQTR